MQRQPVYVHPDGLLGALMGGFCFRALAKGEMSFQLARDLANRVRGSHDDMGGIGATRSDHEVSGEHLMDDARQ